jgi:hypothetical protein
MKRAFVLVALTLSAACASVQSAWATIAPAAIAHTFFGTEVSLQTQPDAIAITWADAAIAPIPLAEMVIGPGKRVYSEPRPIITEAPEGGLEIAGNFSTLEALDEEAQAAIAVLVSAFEQVASPIVLQPGIVLMFNNFRCVHGRGPFSGDRWLQRLYAREDLQALRRVTGQGSDARLFDVRPLILV